MNLNGKVCLITGASRGLGRAMAVLFVKAGAEKVYACDIKVEEQTEAPEALIPKQLNVADAAAVRSTVDEIVAESGRIDVLVNNAGITRDSLIQKLEDDDWEKVINVNLNGVFFVTRAVAPVMMEAGFGSVINMASIVALDGNIGQSNYAATKGGVVSMTKTWAKEFARKGANIRVNAIAPGFIRTPMTESVPEKILDALVAKTPLGRMGEADDVASCALFLASEASSFITGQVIRVDGGLVL